MSPEIWKDIIPGLTIALGGLGPALAIGMMSAKAMEAIGRNPESSDRIRTTLILVVALAEAIAIYSLVVALIVKFV